MELWCTQCDTPLELREIEDMLSKQPVCPKCSAIEFGYTREETKLVQELRQSLGESERWRLHRILADIRRSRRATAPHAEFERLVLEGFVWLGVFYAGVDAFRESTFAKHIDAYLKRLGGESAGG